MKKIRTKMRKIFKGGLCLSLAVCMMLCLLPAAGATGTETTTAPTYEYVFTKDKLSPATTENVYRMADVVEAGAMFNDDEKGYSWKPLGSGNAVQSTAFYAGGYNHSVSNGSKLGANGTLFEITVGESGLYTPSVNFFTYQNGSKTNVYISSKVKSESETSGAYISSAVSDDSESILFSDSFNTHEATISKQWENKGDKNFTNASVPLEKGKSYYLIFSIDGENTSNDKAPVSSTNSKIYNYYQLYSFTLTKVGDLTEQPETVTAPISFVATSNVGEKDMMKVEGFDYDEFTDSVSAGTFVKVTAPEKPGYEFKHWVRGSADNGVYVSDESIYSFTALTHTFLTAIYENVSNENDTTAVVEFYNGNGQYLDKATAKIGETVTFPETAAAPSLTGFEFANQWKTEDGIFDVTVPLVKKLTRAVAQFNTPSTTIDVTYGDEEVPLRYGEEHTFESETDVYWMREETVVGYGKEYTYAAWDATKITTSEAGELVPVVLLDADAKDGARMIEYNAAGKEVLEVGILFGSEGVNIGSCSSKATSRYKNNHGQFTAKPNGSETHARGYLIYKNGTDYRVIYSD